MKIPGKEWLGEPKEHFDIDFERHTIDHVMDFRGSQGLPERPLQLRCDYCQQEAHRLWCRMVRPHSVQLIEKGLHGRGTSTFTGGTWNACESCEALVSARDLSRLITRARVAVRCPAEMLRRAYEAVFACFEDAPAVVWNSGDRFPVIDYDSLAQGAGQRAAGGKQ